MNTRWSIHSLASGFNSIETALASAFKLVKIKGPLAFDSSPSREQNQRSSIHQRRRRKKNAMPSRPPTNVNRAEGSGNAKKPAEGLPGLIVPPELSTSPPTVPLPNRVPCWMFNMPPPMIRSLRIPSSPPPDMVSVLPFKSGELINASEAPKETWTLVSLCSRTGA